MVLWSKLKELWSDESGQTTVEYFLMVAVVVTILMQFKTRLVGLLNKLFKGVTSGVDETINDLNGSSGSGGSGTMD